MPIVVCRRPNGKKWTEPHYKSEKRINELLEKGYLVEEAVAPARGVFGVYLNSKNCFLRDLGTWDLNYPPRIFRSYEDALRESELQLPLDPKVMPITKYRIDSCYNILKVLKNKRGINNLFIQGELIKIDHDLDALKAGCTLYRGGLTYKFNVRGNYFYNDDLSFIVG